MDNIISSYKNLLKDPMSNIPSLLFMGVSIFGIVTLIVSFITDILVFPFMLVAIISSFIAMWYISLLGTLKENIEKMQESINSLKSNNDRLHNEVNAMEELRGHLEVYAEQNQSEFAEVLNNFHKSFKRLEEITIENQKTLLYRIAQDVEFMDNKAGMNEKEYNRFIERLPERLKEKAGELDYKIVSRGEGKVKYNEIREIIRKLS